MPTAAELHSQIASVMEVLANAAVAEICKAVEDGYAVVNLEMSRSMKENECLRRRVNLLELQVSRYRAEQRLKAPDGAGPGRLFPGVRLLPHRHGRDTPPGSSLQTRTRFLNRPQQKSPPKVLDQDPNQEVVTTTKTEVTELDDDQDLIIVKVESTAAVEDGNNNSNSSTSLVQSAEATAQCSIQTEVSGSQNLIEISHGNPNLSHCETTQIYDPNDHNTANTSSSEAARTFAGVSTSFSDVPSTHQQSTSNLQVNVSNHNFENTRQRNVRIRSCHDGPFACSKCPKRFLLAQELTHHLKSHLRQKFTCGLCGKGFVCRSQLEIHRNVHTGARPFSCSICNSWFSHPSNLQRHMKKKHLQQAQQG